PAPGSRRLQRSLHEQLRGAILDGRLKPGLRLPATRALAETLGISRNTAVAASEVLLSEGDLTRRPRPGPPVAAPPPPPPTRPGRPRRSDRRLALARRNARPTPHFPQRPTFRHDFRLGLPDTALFPFALWRRLSGRALRVLSRQPAIYAEAEGRTALREAIAR